MGLFSTKKKSSPPTASSSSSSSSPRQASSLHATKDNGTAVTDPKRLEHQTQLLQKHGVVEKNSERKLHPVYRLRSPVVSSIKNDTHLNHEARETQGAVFEGKRNGTKLKFQATAVEKYNKSPHTQRDLWGFTKKTTGELMESGDKRFNGTYGPVECQSSCFLWDGDNMRQPFTPMMPPTRDAAMKTLDRVRKEATTGNPVGNAFDSLQRQGRINFYPQPIFVRDNGGNPVLTGWT